MSDDRAGAVRSRREWAVATAVERFEQGNSLVENTLLRLEQRLAELVDSDSRPAVPGTIRMPTTFPGFDNQTEWYAGLRAYVSARPRLSLFVPELQEALEMVLAEVGKVFQPVATGQEWAVDEIQSRLSAARSSQQEALGKLRSWLGLFADD